MIPWKTFIARAVVASGLVGVAMFVALRLATASPGGPTRDDLTYAGVLRERAGMAGTTLTFVFRRGTAVACTTTTDPFMPDSAGAFSVLVPLRGSACPNPRSLFDGDDIVYDVRLGGATGEVIAPSVPITPVPHARFADQAGVNNDCPVGYESTTDSFFTRDSGRRLCQKSRMEGAARVVYDEVVRVGSGASAFWIDR